MKTRHLIRHVTHTGSITLHGPNGLLAARLAIREVMSRAGLAITFDPTSAPDLVDCLTVTTLSSLEGATAGACLGTLVGLLFDSPKEGAAIGALVGALAGTERGVQKIKDGWRVRAVRTHGGVPLVTITALKAE